MAFCRRNYLAIPLILYIVYLIPGLASQYTVLLLLVRSITSDLPLWLPPNRIIIILDHDISSEQIYAQLYNYAINMAEQKMSSTYLIQVQYETKD